MPEHKKTYNQLAGQNVARIETISDGVFAIAMTLLVLDIKVPVSNAIKTEADLFAAFCKLTPQLLSYFLSFMTIGIFFMGHSSQYTYINKSDRHQTWIALFFLMFISLLPFTTAFLSEHIEFKLSIALYWLNIFALGATIYFHWAYAYRHNHLSIEGEEKETVNKAMKTRIFIAQALYLAAALLCFINTYLSIIAIILIQLNYTIGLISGRNKKG
jgi:uncharacterized membrane protein